ncbi:acyl-CoA dehydrogenase [Alkalilimnicola ehrlichii]|uniref:acyl-CoA dehydrogenase n=1 Tax=Alkalilimnicola ehrlichii TaxID=351052 RepID=UPI001C6EB7D5|nr:acyl-CoA dehydrogenase [Alkalilimnicola ehrlichii]
MPKYLVNDDGSLGERNDVALAGLIHKMGWRGTTSTMLNFGEKDGAKAYLIGEPGKGLKYMFHMMNEARIGVGMGAVVLGYAGYLQALEYAKGRRQGRPVDSKDPAQKPVPLIEHADIKRMLLAQKAYVEGGLSLCMFAASLVDEKRTTSDEAAASEADLLLDVMTPMVKAWPSQYCLEANNLAIQVHGGYGYTREYQVEQLYRDNRLNPIHEGTNGIQGLDLLGRKVMMQNGAGFDLLVARIKASIEEGQANSTVQPYAAQLAAALAKAIDTTQVLRQTLHGGQAAKALANATIYLDLMGQLVVAWLWLQQALAAERGLRSGETQDEAFYRGKLAACQYFFHYELPKVYQHADLLTSLDTTCLEAEEAWF